RGDIDIYRRFLRYGAKENNVGTRLTYLSRYTVSIFRDLSNINETRVIFKLYPLDLLKEVIRETRPII
ncbi:hypothetical protein N7457_006530, partial [Penicillium paradoxum]|uniref:uncharacterized protein n=1 Tax=Penicillium paradoxum TaxID=176176 RepID=UPI0025487D55